MVSGATKGDVYYIHIHIFVPLNEYTQYIKEIEKYILHLSPGHEDQTSKRTRRRLNH